MYLKFAHNFKPKKKAISFRIQKYCSKFINLLKGKIQVNSKDEFERSIDSNCDYNLFMQINKLPMQLWLYIFEKEFSMHRFLFY